MKALLLTLGLLALTSRAFGSIAVGHGDVNSSVTATVTHDSNIFGKRDATADESATIVPRISYTRMAGLIQAEANTGISFIRYRNHSELDAENVDADAAVRIPESNVRNYYGSLSVAFRETSAVDTDVNTRLDTRYTTFVGHASVVTGPKTIESFGGSHASAHRTGFSDQDFFALEAIHDYTDFFNGNSLRLIGTYNELHSSGENARLAPLNQNAYSLSAGLGRTLFRNALRAGVSYGYRVLNRNRGETSSGVQQTRGSVISASLEGPFLPTEYFPKVESKFSVTYQDAASPGINDTGNSELTGTLALGWDARPKTRVSFGAQRTQRLSVNDLTVVTSNVELGLTQKLRPNLSATFSAGHSWSSYGDVGRRDRTVSLSGGLDYTFTRLWSASLTYVSTSNTSTLVESNVDRDVVSASLVFKF